MLLRSSSTPVLGSLLSSISESPNNNHHHYQSEVPHATTKHPPTTTLHNHNKLSFNQVGSLNFTTFSCNSSPINPCVAEFSDVGKRSQNGFQRAQSDGNLEGLVDSSSSNDEFCVINPFKKYSRRPNGTTLQPIPSFSLHNSRCSYEDDDSPDNEEMEDKSELFDVAIFRGEERFGDTKVNELSLVKNMGLNQEMRHMNEYGNVPEEVRSETYPARGLGVTGVINLGFGSGGSGGGGNCIPVDFSRDGSDGDSMEEHYKRMVEENPGNPLCLRNYAQFLYESKQDLQRADEYYSRAILADPKDGEIMAKYAKLVWELHCDKDRATSYFERAVQAASEDSHVHAAYASFLWEVEEEDEEDAPSDPYVVPPLLRQGAMASASA